MDIIVVDTSIALRWVLPDEKEQASQSLLTRWMGNEVLLFAPPVFLAEVMNGLRQAFADGRIEEQDLATGIRETLRAQPYTLEPHGLYEEAVSVALRYRSRLVYDFLFFALAERLSAELWTGDARFVRGLRPRPPWVRLL